MLDRTKVGSTKKGLIVFMSENETEESKVSHANSKFKLHACLKRKKEGKEKINIITKKKLNQYPAFRRSTNT
jgi:hypothetical protein